MPIKISGLPLALRKHRSWDRTLNLPQPSASMTMNWMSSMTSFLWAQLRAQQAHRQGSYHHDQTDKESMEEQQADWSHKDPDLQSLRREHPPIWQWVPDIACPTRAKAQYFSHAQPPTHSEYRLAGQGPKQHWAGKSWMHQHVHVAETETYALALLRRAHGRRTDPQRPVLRRTCAGKLSHRQTTAAIPRCVQEGPKDLEHRPEQLGSNSHQRTVQKGLSSFEETLAEQHEKKRTRRKSAAHADRPASDFVCALCHRDDWPATPDAVLE